MLIVLLYWPLHIAQRLRGLGYTPWLALIYFASMALSVLPFILYFGLGLIFSGEESEGKGFQVKSGKGLALRSSQRAGEIRVDDLFGE